MLANDTWRKWIAGLLAFQALFIFTPMWILGDAIGWPASLDLPPSEVLPLIAGELTAVRLGYGLYLAYSINWIIVGTALTVVSAGSAHRHSILVTLAVTLACVSAVARAIGIIRWLTASTALSGSGEFMTGVKAAQLAVNSWGGAIGEFLGVAMFASFWLVAVSLLILRSGTMPRWLGGAGLVVSLLVFLPVSELFGITLISVVASTTAMHFWLLACAGALFFTPADASHT